MDLSTNATLTHVAHEYAKVAESFQQKRKWNEMSENELWGKLCLCILSSNVPYELALSAFWHLCNSQLLSQEWIIRSKIAFQQIASELAKRKYLPRKKDGSYRKYRFPNIRAKNIVDAAKVLYEENCGLLKLLEEFNFKQEEARCFLARNIPGVGLKQASHFLRDIGYSSTLAIIDSHVIAFLIEVGAVSQGKIKVVTPKIYIRLERVLRDLCNSFGFNLSIFDMAIWRYMRGQ